MNRPEPASSAAPGEQTNGSVFDFLYYDRERIGSFLSQFDSFGHLTSIRHSERASRGRADKFSMHGKAGVGVAGGGVGSEESVQADYGQDSERGYDPRWANALSFLDYLQEKRLVQRELTRSRIGQIVLFSGALSIFDLSILQRMWEMPGMRAMILRGAHGQEGRAASERLSRADRKRLQAATKDKTAQAPSEADLALEIMSIMPHAVQVAISNDNDAVWGTLHDQSLIGTPADLLMKHGIQVAGEWSIVGIVDAIPDDPDYFPPDGGPPLSHLRQMSAGASLGYLSFTIAANLVPPVRTLLGRPTSSYGITPLLIFRQLNAIS